MDIENITLKFLQQYNLLESDSVWVVGFSCGYDSMCLLDVLDKIAKSHSIKLVAAHLNHNWRGEESFDEQQESRKFCETRNIEFYTETLDESVPKTETVARDYRYYFFSVVAKKFGAKAVFTAHSRTDNAETILYRIIKGTGINGISGIQPQRKMADFSVYRPLLEIGRDETIKYCSDKGLSPCDDSSNYNKKYTRNKIRLDLMPELEKINPKVESALVQLGLIAKDYEQIVQACIAPIDFEQGASTAQFLALDESKQRIVVRNFLCSCGLEYDYQRIRIIIDNIKEYSTIKAGKKFSISTNMWLFVSSGQIKLLSSCSEFFEDDDLEIDENEEIYVNFLKKSIKISKFEASTPAVFPKETEQIVYADLSKISFPLVVRTRNPGDIIQPFGMKGKMKLKKYFVSKNIPRFKRDVIPLLVSNKEVLWAVGVGISEKLRVFEAPTHIIEIK